MKKIRANQIEVDEVLNASDFISTTPNAISLHNDSTSVFSTTTSGVEVSGILSFVPEGSPILSTPQIVLSNYATVDYPATTLDGGLIYDSTAKIITYYNGTEWTGIYPNKNWITANGGDDFTTPPSVSAYSGLAIGDSASAASGTGVAIGNSALSKGTAVAIGSGATDNAAGGGNGVAIGDSASCTLIRAIAIGPDSIASGVQSIALGYRAATTRSGAIAIGDKAYAGPTSGTTGTSHIAIGNSARARGGAYSTYSNLAIGHSTTTYRNHQVVVGSGLGEVAITNAGGTDVAHSVKIGSGQAGDINVLHLHSKGKLELVGDDAQFVLPSYVVTGSPIDVPANSVEGGLIYDSTGKALAFYNGTSWEQVPKANIDINVQTGTAYTLELSDADVLVTMDNAAANTLTIPTNASVALPIGTQILIEQEGAGTTTITSAGSPPVPTIHSAGNLFDTASQYTAITLIKKAPDTWLIVGDLV